MDADIRAARAAAANSRVLLNALGFLVDEQFTPAVWPEPELYPDPALDSAHGGPCLTPADIEQEEQP